MITYLYCLELKEKAIKKNDYSGIELIPIYILADLFMIIFQPIFYIIYKSINQNKTEIEILKELIKTKNEEIEGYEKSLNKRCKESINLKINIAQAIEYIGNGNLGIPRKTREKFIKILKGEKNESN